jgi:hypothetical protein
MKGVQYPFSESKPIVLHSLEGNNKNMQLEVIGMDDVKTPNIHVVYIDIKRLSKELNKALGETKPDKDSKIPPKIVAKPKLMDMFSDLGADEESGLDTVEVDDSPFPNLRRNKKVSFQQLMNLSFLASWGLDEDIDLILQESGGIQKHNAVISFGLMGEGGCMSLTVSSCSHFYILCSKLFLIYAGS